MRKLDRFVAVTMMGSFLMIACQPQSSGPKEPSKDVPKALSRYRGGDNPPSEPATTKAERDQELASFDNADGLDFNLKNQCAIELCGPVLPKEPQATAEQDAANKAFEAKFEDVNRDYKPIIQNIVDLDHQELQLHIQKLDEMKDQIKNLKPADSYRAMINFTWAVSYFTQLADTWDGTRFDESKARAHLNGKLPEVELNHLMNMTKSYLASTYLQYSNYIDVYGLDFLFEKLAKSSDPAAKKAAAKKWASIVVGQINRLKKEFPLFYPEPIEALEALAAGKDISPEQSANISEEMSAGLIFDVLFNSGDAFIKRDFSLSEVTDQYFAKKRSELVRDLAPERKDARVKLASQSCEATVYGFLDIEQYEARALAFAPKLIQNVRSHAIKAVGDFTESAEVARSVEEKIQSTRFSMPVGRTAGLEKLKTSLKTMATDSRIGLELLRNGKPEDLAIILVADVYNNPAKQDEIVQNCSEQNPLRYSDYSKSGFGFIQISWATILRSDAGYGVIAHEFGHEVSAQLRNFSDELKTGLVGGIFDCLIERKSDPLQETSEEDFADAFADRVLKKVLLTQPEMKRANLNYGCSLMGRDEVRWGSRSGLSLSYPKDFKEAHSTSFYRTLQLHIDSGAKLPETCAAIVSKGKPTMMNACLK